jgi:putative phosphoesterase
MNEVMFKIGIISDTHGSLPREVHDVFQNVQEIIHAGDIGTDDVLTELGMIAPVQAVFGNMDGYDFRKKFSAKLEYQRMGYWFIITHFKGIVEFKDIPIVHIYGHTHLPKIKKHGQVLYINPGSATRPPEGHNASVALLTIPQTGNAEAEIIYLGEKR